MPEVILDTPLLLKESDYDYLQTSFKEWIEAVEDSRRERMRKIWEKAARNYAGKAPRMDLPWQGASNAVLNITQSHTDNIQARLYSAGANGEPTYMITAGTGEPILDDAGAPIVSAQKYAIWWQNISEHVEVNEVNHKEALEESTWLTALYGDAWIYVSWIKDEVMDVSVGADGKLTKTPRTITDQPVLTVLHPERVYLAPWESDPQKAKTIAFDFDLDEHDLLIKERRKVYLKGRVEELRKILDGTDRRDPDARTKLTRALEVEGHFKEWGTDTEGKGLRALLDEQSGIDSSIEPRALKMLRVFQRVVLESNADALPEEIQFDVEKSTGTVAVARYSNLLHRLRPLVHFYYSRRPGSPNNVGVPEMLFNAQKILDNLIRDLLNNNKVKNTKLFLSKVGSPIKKQSQIFPSRLLTVNDVDKDFKVVDLGSSGGVTGLQEIGLIQQWAERLTGVTEANLGLQAKSRTPVGVNEALLEQGSMRLERTIDRQGEAQADMWMQVLCLYRQNGDPRKLAKIAGIEEQDLPLFLSAWAAVPPERMTEMIHIRPQVSSSAFNRAQQKTELMTVIGQTQVWYEQLMLLANHSAAALQVGDDSFRELILAMAKGGHKLMQKFLSLHDEKEQDDLNPEILITLLEGVQSVGAGQQDDGGSSPAEAASGGAAAGATPGESGPADGRPAPGVPRSPGPPNGAPNAGGGPA